MTKTMKDLKGKSAAELLASVREAREKLRGLRLDLAAGKVKNVGELRAVRKSIARMLTLVSQEKKSAK